jgi:small subunit ribosomal protein S4
MGDPKFSRRKYVTPSHPWQGERITEENELIRKYGLKNKTELWKVQSLLRVLRQRARQLQAKVRYGDVQAEKEREQLLNRLGRMGLLGDEASLDDVLGLSVEDLLGRRLQTMTYLKGLSSSSKQARQFIVHGHIGIDERRVTIPGYYVKRSEEEAIDYLPGSPLSHDLHPARPREEGELEPESPREAEDKKGEEVTEPEQGEKEEAKAPEGEPHVKAEPPKEEGGKEPSEPPKAETEKPPPKEEAETPKAESKEAKSEDEAGKEAAEPSPKEGAPKKEKAEAPSKERAGEEAPADKGAEPEDDKEGK